jgi:Fe-S-cluster containining protein
MIDAKIAALSHVTGVLGEYMASRQWACERGCAHCCTCNVALTTLEGFVLAEHLGQTGLVALNGRLRKKPLAQRFTPTMTTNALADHCAAGGTPPPERNEPLWGVCPVIQGNECPVYDVRPLMCRSMVSATSCSHREAAEIDPFTVTVVHVMQQYVEHIDRDGYTGNLMDVIDFLEAPAVRGAYAVGRLNGLERTPSCLMRNRPVSVLMVPPEHRSRMAPILDALNRFGA